MPAHLGLRVGEWGLFILRVGPGLYVDGGGGHGVLDGDLGADFEVAGDLGVGGAVELPLFFALCTVMASSVTARTVPVTW
jgi:hypothetical protein